MTLEVHGRNMPIGPRSGGGCSPAGWIAVLAAAWLSMTATGVAEDVRARRAARSRGR